MTHLYALLDGLALLGPLALSFDRRVAFFRSWGAVFPALLVMMLLFIPADIAFTAAGIWQFDDRYVLGLRVFGLPIEEWAFFFVVGYACLFIYECLRAYLHRDLFGRSARWILLGITLLGLGMVLLYPTRLYTSIKVGGAVVGLVLFVVFAERAVVSRFLLLYLISIVPFFLMNSVLTGSLIEGQIVWYNPAHIIGVRLGTIPVEDLFYNLIMLLVATAAFEWFRGRRRRQA